MVVDAPDDLEDIPCNGEFPPEPAISVSDDCGSVDVDFAIEYEENVCEGYEVFYKWTLTDDVGNITNFTLSFNVLPDRVAFYSALRRKHNVTSNGIPVVVSGYSICFFIN